MAGPSEVRGIIWKKIIDHDEHIVTTSIQIYIFFLFMFKKGATKTNLRDLVLSTIEMDCKLTRFFLFLFVSIDDLCSQTKKNV